MPIGQSLLPEFDHEMANTRKMLERVPDARFEYKPHVKSPSMGWLAGHLANLPSWIMVAIDRDELDVAPADGPALKLPVPSTNQEVVELFDKNVAAARARLATVSDAELMKPWTLKARGQERFTMPKGVVVRSFVLNHVIHHRAQLGVYLRLNDLPVPSIYGPSADEGAF
jgi:uncharacterized damage-inducible protein DinB